MSPIRLQDLCPRLARARDQWVAFENARDEAIGVEVDNVLRLERLVAHRELQHVRAMSTARRSWGRDYLVHRERTLREAHQALLRARKRLAGLKVQT